MSITFQATQLNSCMSQPPKKPGYEDRNYATMKHAMRKEFGVIADPKEPVEVARDHKGKFVKGQSGNPNGKPKRVLPNGADFKELYKMRLPQIIEKQWKLINDKNTPAHVREKAMAEWTDRALGKAKQTLEVDSTVNQTTTAIDVSGMSLDALRQLRDAVAKSEPIDAEIVEPEELPSPEDGDV